MPDSPAPRHVLLTRGAGFLALWLVLMGPALKDLPVGIVAAAAAAWTSAILWPARGGLSLPGILRFLVRFLPQSVAAGLDVARRACCAVMSLQPGKLPVAAEPDGTLHIHCLDLREPVTEQLAADEAAFCETLQDGGRNG